MHPLVGGVGVRKGMFVKADYSLSNLPFDAFHKDAQSGQISDTATSKTSDHQTAEILLRGSDTRSEEFVRTDAPLQTNKAPDENSIDRILSIIQKLPNNFVLPKIAIDYALNEAQATNDPQVRLFLNGVNQITKNGNHFELKRNEVSHIQLNQDVIKGLVSIKTLDLSSLNFNLESNNNNTKRLTHITGLNLTFNAFGHDQTVGIEEAHIAHDNGGNTLITGMVENPVAPAARTVLDIGDRIPVSIKITPDGHVVPPRASSVIQAASQTTGKSLPGLVMRDELGDAADVAKFVERYPAWTGGIVTPILAGLEQVIEENHKKDRAAQQSAEKSLAAPGAPEAVPGKPVVAPVLKPDHQLVGRPNARNVSDIPNNTGDIDKTIKIDGVDRHYILHLPRSYDPAKPAPMIVALHGMSGNAKEFEGQTNLNAIADKEGYIIAYPDSTQWFGQKDWTTWDTDNGILPPGKHASDPQFLRTIIEDTQKTFSVDSKRIFMAGISNGGMETFHAAASLSDKLAAIAVVSGAMSGTEDSPTAPMSVLNIHGTNDSIIPIGGIENVPDSLTQLGIPTFKPNSYVADYWKTKNHITSKPTTVVNGSETRQRYFDPATGAEVEQIVEAGGEHIPGNIPKTMNTIVQFFDRHTKIPVTPETAPPPNDPPQEKRALVDPVQRLIGNVKKRGVTGIEDDVDMALSAVPLIPDGSISPSAFYRTIDSTIHQNLNDPISSFIKTTDSISKTGSHIEMKRSETAVIPINYEVPGTHGLLDVKDAEIGTTALDLKNQNGLFSIENLSGIKINAQVLKHSISTEIQQISESEKPDGNHVYSIKVSHPLPAFARFVLMQPKQINVNVELDKTGNPSIVDQSQLMDDVLGRNYLVRGTIDEGTDIVNAVKRPTLKNVSNGLKDVAITAATTYLGSRFKLVGAAVGFVAAPVIIHELDKYTT